MKYLLLLLALLLPASGQKIGDLTSISGNAVAPATDRIPILDASANIVKKIAVGELLGIRAGWKDVRDYPGVEGDGINDDTVGIQAAMDDAVADNMPLYFGPVTVRYKVTDYINIDGSVPAIIGTGMDDLTDSVIRQATANKGVFRYRVISPAPSNNYTTFRDLRIEGSSTIANKDNDFGSGPTGDSKGIWIDGDPSIFYDEVNFERVYVRGFTHGIYCARWSNSYMLQATVEACYNGYFIGESNNNSNTFYNCFAAGCTNIAASVSGTGTTLNLIAFECGGHGAGNGSKAVVVTAGKVRWISGNVEDFSGLRATDAANTTPGIVEVGLNGQLFIEDVTFSAGSWPTGLPINFAQYNIGGEVRRCQMLSYTAGYPLARTYRDYSDRLLYFQPKSAGGEVWIYSDATFTGTPAKLRELSVPTYHPSDIPAASQSRSGQVFATYDDGGATPEQRWVVAKTGSAAWGNVALGFMPRTPASATASGVTGTVVWDTSYIYVCTATNTWKRVALATW